MNYKDIISRIKSVRDYKDETVDPKILSEIKEYSKHSKRLIEDIEIEALLKDADEVYRCLENAAGYNEFMLKAPHYLIFLSEDKDYYIENIGYTVQNVMLKAFEMGVGSCWVTIENGDEIKERLNIDSYKKLAAIIALGYDDNKSKIIYNNQTDYNPSKADVRIIEDNVSERKSVSEVVYINEWGKNADVDQLERLGLLEAFFHTRLAPSTKNRQPWKFIYDDGTVVLFLREDECATEYEAKIDTGIVMLYFELIVDSTLMDLKWRMGKPDKEYKAPEYYNIAAYCTI